VSQGLTYPDITLRSIPSSTADEESLMDDADMQTANQEGSASDIVEGAKD
jgi:hypothetical protein